MDIQPIESNRPLLNLIYSGLLSVGADIPEFNIWEENIAFIYPTRTGGIVLRRATWDRDTWYIDGYCPKSFPKLKELRALIVVCQLLGCKEIRAYTPYVSSRFYERIGFEKIGMFSHGLKLDPNPSKPPQLNS